MTPHTRAAEVWNTSADVDERLTPLTGLEGAFTRARLLSGMVIEDIGEYARVGQIFKDGAEMGPRGDIQNSNSASWHTLAGTVI